MDEQINGMVETIQQLEKENAELKLHLSDVSGQLPISCVNDFEKPEYCSQRNNHLCQKCKDW